jgi:hypothetical protein
LLLRRIWAPANQTDIERTMSTRRVTRRRSQHWSARAGTFGPKNLVAFHRRWRCRRVSRLENEAVLGRMATPLKATPEILARRRETVEHPFGTIKQWMNQGAFLMRGLIITDATHHKSA